MILLNVEYEYGGVISLEKEDMTSSIHDIWENNLTQEQVKTIHAIIRHLNAIIDLEKIQEWCTQHAANVMIFGSRTRGHHRTDSDLDLMITPTFSVPLEEVETYLKHHHDTFEAFLKESIELDFKLNTSDSDVYAGFTFTGNPLPEEGLDFIFDWNDIPSYLEIDANRMVFEVTDKEEFEGNQFRRIHY